MIFLLLILSLPVQASWIPNLEIQLKWQWAAGGDARVIPGRDVLVRENIQMDVGGVGESPRNLDSFFVGFNLKWELDDTGGERKVIRTAPSPRRDCIPSTLSRRGRGERFGNTSVPPSSDVSFEKIRIIKLKKLYGALGYELDEIDGASQHPAFG